jgi:hypothetical protein
MTVAYRKATTNRWQKVYRRASFDLMGAGGAVFRLLQAWGSGETKPMTFGESSICFTWIGETAGAKELPVACNGANYQTHVGFAVEQLAKNLGQENRNSFLGGLTIKSLRLSQRKPRNPKIFRDSDAYSGFEI